MPKLELTNREAEYLKNLMFCNRVDGHSYQSKKLNEKEGNKQECELLKELEENIYNKTDSLEFDGFKG